MSGEMVERVARALWAHYQSCIPVTAVDYDATDETLRRVARGYARAAIEAMREPTEGQYEALCATDKLWRELNSRTVWQTYIDAALIEDAVTK